MPRRFIRHPATIPIQLQQFSHPENLVITSDVSAGGLSCKSSEMVEPGVGVLVKIYIEEPPFEVKGYVVWCRREKDCYRVGISFSDLPSAYTVRMIEQVCHISQYRQQLLNEGRDLSEEEAAREWIANNAAQFYSEYK